MAYRVLRDFDLAGRIMSRDEHLTARQEAAMSAAGLERYTRLGFIAAVAGPPADEPDAVPYHHVSEAERAALADQGQAYAVAVEGTDLYGQRWPRGQRLTPQQRNGLLRRDVAMPDRRGDGRVRVESLLDKLVRDGVLVEVEGACAHRADQTFLPGGSDSRYRVPRRKAPPVAAPVAAPAPALPVLDPAQGGSVLDRALALLAARGELAGDDLLAALGNGTTKGALTSALQRGIKRGAVKRVAPGIYAAA